MARVRIRGPPREQSFGYEARPGGEPPEDMEYIFCAGFRGILVGLRSIGRVCRVNIFFDPF